MIAPDLDAIPISLAIFTRWLLWKTATHKDKATKVLRQIDGTAASSTCSEFWPVTNTLGRRPDLFDGIGVVLGDVPDGPHLAGIDLDGCVDDRGRLAHWTHPIAAALPNYIEISPSGTGLKASFRCRADDADELRAAFGIRPPQRGCKRSVANQAFAHSLAERPDPADVATEFDASTTVLRQLAFLILHAGGVP